MSYAPACRRRGGYPVQYLRPPSPGGRGGHARDAKPTLPAVHQVPPVGGVQWVQARVQEAPGSSQSEARGGISSVCRMCRCVRGLQSLATRWGTRGWPPDGHNRLSIQKLLVLCSEATCPFSCGLSQAEECKQTTGRRSQSSPCSGTIRLSQEPYCLREGHFLKTAVTGSNLHDWETRYWEVPGDCGHAGASSGLKTRMTGFRELPKSYKTFADLELQLYHIDMKIAGVTPADLPPDLAGQLMSYHEAMPREIEGTMRPGCVHLSVDFIMGSAEDRSSALKTFLQNLQNDVASGAAAQRNVPWGRFDTTAILPNATVQIRDQGQSVRVLPRADGPIIHRIAPMVINGLSATVEVSNLVEEDITVLCRVGGRQHELEVTSVNEHPDDVGHWMVEFRIPPLATGFAWIEVMQQSAAGMVLSAPQAMLITYWEEISEEVSTLGTGNHGLRQGQVNCLLRDLGMALHSAEAPPLSVFAGCLARTARLGFHGTFEALRDEVLMRELPLSEVLGIANELPGGNLVSLAVQSGSLATLQKVSVLSAEAGVEVQADRVDQESGMAAVHWAAAAQLPHMLSELMRCSPGAAGAWRSLPGGQYGLTPCEMFGPAAAVFEQQRVPDQASTADSQYAESVIESRTAAESTSREAPGWSTQADLTAAFAAGLLSTAVVLGSAPRKCGSLLLMVPGSLLLTMWFCWHKYATTLDNMRQLARSAGFELSWFLAPTDPEVEAAYCCFVTLKVSTWLDTLSFGGMLAVPLLMAMGFCHVNHGPRIGLVSFGLLGGFVSLALAIRRSLTQRSALRGLEWFNMMTKLSLSLSWEGAMWMVLQQERVLRAGYMDSLLALPIAVMILHASAVALAGANILFPPFHTMVMWRLITVATIMAQGYLSFKISPISHSIETEIAHFTVACILSSGVYFYVRLQKEQSHLSGFISRINSKAGQFD
mmetsp:Transcript_17517/g.48899  ORF Transcript_17517/g.48899 Transcript_17517/m.48899 type:complete len:939 (+) Transcript_17517:710-3526(+)